MLSPDLSPRMSACRSPRLPTIWPLALSACVWLFALCAPASAQSFFEQLFGIAKPNPVPPLLPPAPLSRPAVSSPQFDKPSVAPQSGGTYRTVCVRMCDGFFVPISFSTRRDNFQQDRAKCRATCGDDARLFFHRNPGEAIEDAVDLSGRPYNHLPNAFRFRKTRVEGCACRPPPWSEAEVARHQSYAAVATPAAAAPTMPATAANTPLTQSQATALAREAKGATAITPPSSEPVMARVEKPERRNQKSAEVSRKAFPAPQKAVKLASSKPHVAPPQVADGMFGSGPTFGQGLTGKPKYVWPGD